MTDTEMTQSGERLVRIEVKLDQALNQHLDHEARIRRLERALWMVPYVAWLDYGGRVGRRAAVRREYVKEGRYLYPGYAKNAGQVRAVLVAALHRVADEAGLEVTF